MRILAFSDLHRDLDQAAQLTEMATDADLVIGAGDFASVHEGLGSTIKALSSIAAPALLVPGNNETRDDLRDAATAWPSAQVLHGDSAEIDGITFFGLGGGIPTTPWDWSFDLDKDETSTKLAQMPEQTKVVILHSPPLNSCDATTAGQHLGSPELRTAIEQNQPSLVVCGHIHESWGVRDMIGGTEVVNLGPAGTFFEI